MSVSSSAEKSAGDKMLSFWEKRAGLYGQLCIDSITQFETEPEVIARRVEHEKKHLLPLIKPTPESNVLDLGCGPGRWTAYLAPRCKRVVAVDFSAGMIKAARAEVDPRFMGRCEFLVASAADFYRPEKFDLILMLGLLIYLNDEQSERTLAHVAGMLADGGRIISKESIGLEERYVLREKFSEVMQQNYSATYRTENELAAMIGRAGLKIRYSEFVYPLDSEVRKFKETAPKLFVLER